MPRCNQPNQFVLSGDGVQITYEDTGSLNEPKLFYNERSFARDAIRTQRSELGNLITVILERVLDGDTITLTLLVPDFVLGEKEEDHIETLAIKTTHHNTIAGPPPGATQTYEVFHLEGSAKCIFSYYQKPVPS